MSLCWGPAWPDCRRRAIWRAAGLTCSCWRPARAWAAGWRRPRCPTAAPCRLGGEVIGHAHTAYLELVAELGLTVEPSYVADPGEISWGLEEGVFVGDDAPWMTAEERADAERIDGLFASLASEVDPDDPWSHPDASRLDQLSLGAWLRLQGALPAVRRRYALASLSLSCDGPDRTSLLADLRKHATLAGRRLL